MLSNTLVYIKGKLKRQRQVILYLFLFLFLLNETFRSNKQHKILKRNDMKLHGCLNIDLVHRRERCKIKCYFY